MRLRLLLPLLALLSLGGVTWIVVRSRAETPEFLLTSARQRRSDPVGDMGLALREIQEGLRLVRADEDSPVRLELLRERARVHTDQGLIDLALRDLERILGLGPPDPDVLQDACRACLWLDDPARTLELAQELEAFEPAKARVFVGRARVALADRPLARIATLAHENLATPDERHAIRLAHRAAVFAADAELSEVAREELEELFARAEDRRVVMELVHEAAEHLEIARKAFVESLEPETSSDAVAGLQDLLLRAGADVDAAELGEVALSLPGLGPPMPILVRTAPTLLRLGRRQAASALIQAVSPDRTAMGFLPSHALRDELLDWCRLLEDLEMWRILRPAALELEERSRRRPNSPTLLIAHFLLGRCDLADGELLRARSRFDLVSLQTTMAPPDAVRTWLGLAEIASQRKDADQERFALLQAARFSLREPDPELVAAQAAAWDRLSVLTRARGDSEVADHWLTQALTLEPTEARVERWSAEGRTNLSIRNFGGPYRSYSQASYRLEHGDPVAAGKEADDLLKRYPGLAPALEIRAEAALQRRDYRIAVESCLRLLERDWHRDETSRRLAAVPPEYLVPAERLRWLRLDPGASLAPILRSLEAAGDARRVALAVRTPGSAALAPEERARAGRLLLASDLLEEATYVLDGSPEARAQLPLGLRLRSALALAQKTGAEEALERALGDLGSFPVDADWPLAVDELLAAGRTAAARAVVVRMLAAGASPVLGDALVRSAVLHMLEAPGASSSEPLERAAALLPAGLAEGGRLFLAGDRDDAEALAREARSALRTPLAREPARALLLALLADDLPRAFEGVTRHPIDGRDPLLALAAACLQAIDPETATPPAERDPAASLDQAFEPGPNAPARAALPRLPDALVELGAKRVALIALAADLAPYSAWALARLDQWPEVARNHPWCAFLRARATSRLGAERTARALLDAALTAPDVPAAVWSARAELAPPGEALAFHIGWLRAAGLEGAPDPVLALWQGAERAERGLHEEAVAWLERALEEAPDDPDLLAELARIESTPGRRVRALERWNELLGLLPVEECGPFVLPTLDNLRAARDAGEIGESRWWSEVEALEAEQPDDPAPARELAARAFETPREGHGRALALERLSRFHRRTLDRPVESLRAGEARRWTRLLARYTPDGAVEFAARELAAAPYSPEVWRAWIEALIAAERWTDALRDLEAVLAVAPDLETARLSALTGYFVREDPSSFLSELQSIEALDPEVMEADRQLAFFRGVASLRTTTPKRLEFAKQCWELWAARREAGLLTQRNGRALAISLFAAGKGTQAEAALTQCLESGEGALASDVTKALGYLIRAAPNGARLVTEPRERKEADKKGPSKGGAKGAPRENGTKQPARKGGRTEKR